MNQLRFAGELPVWAAVALALGLALAAFLLYRRELRSGWAGWILPGLRALAVLLIVLILAGPELAHVTGEDHRGRVLVLVDASQSMGVTDPQMPLNEKLQLAGRLGLAKVAPGDAGLIDAQRQLARAVTLAGDEPAWNDDAPAAAAGFASALQEAKRAIESFDTTLALQFQNEAVGPAEALRQDIDDRDARSSLAYARRIAEALVPWQNLLAERLDRQARDHMANGAGDDALNGIDAMTRWQRIEKLLLDLDGGALSSLTADNNVTLVTLSDAEKPGAAVSSTDPKGLPDELPGQPDAAGSDLSSELERLLAESGGGDRLAVVVVSDGRQNQGPGLSDAALRARAAGVPVHAIAVGTAQMPRDLAVADVVHPASVFPDGRVSGSIKLIDAMDPGQRFTVQIVHGEEVLWEASHMTGGGGGARVQTLDYSFDARAAVDAAEQATPEGLKVNQLPIALQARVIGLEGDTQALNDQMDFQVRAVMGNRKMLILAGRPRWEMRYLDAMFSRDPRWEVTTLFSATGDGNRWPRSDDSEDEDAFPATRNALMDYDIIVMGELRPGTLSDGELTWLYEFVANRAGGMIIIDGRRGDLANYARTPIAPLLPRRSNDRGRRPSALELTPAGRIADALSLEPDTAGNQRLWRSLEPPSFIAPIAATPGLDTVLIEAKVSATSDETWPAVLSRRVGAGWVWYSAIDETWRWRKDHESLYQHRYWHQVTNRVIEPLYAAEDAFVSLGVDQSVVDPGGTLPIRVRLRDKQGRPRTAAEATVYLATLQGKRVLQGQLIADAVEGGRFTAELEPKLAPGVYEVGVSIAGMSDSDLLARTLVTIRGNSEMTGELADVTLNLPLLQQAASATGGTVLREYEIDQLPDLLAGLSESTRQETVTKLWQSWPWFLGIVGLLALEFGLRRRMGLI